MILSLLPTLLLTAYFGRGSEKIFLAAAEVMAELDEVDDGVEARLVFNEESGLSGTRLPDEIGIVRRCQQRRKPEPFGLGQVYRFYIPVDIRQGAQAI